MSGVSSVGTSRVREFLRPFAQPVTYLGLAMLAFTYGVVGYLLVNDRMESEQAALRRGQNVVQIVEASVAHVFRSVDSSLLFLREIYRNDPAAFDIAAWVNNTGAKNELTDTFTIVDAGGRVVHTTYGNERVGSDFSKLSSYLFHSKATSDQFLIDRPFESRWSGKWIIPISRRIATPDGRFDGLIVAIINPEDLARHLGNVDLGPEGIVALIGLDGYLRTRVLNGRWNTSYLGERLPATTKVLQAAERNKSGSFWNNWTLIDRSVRLATFRTVEPFPLIALVSITEAEVFRRANENARLYGLIAALLTAFLVVAVWLGAARQRRLNDATAKMQGVQDLLRQSQERYRLVESAVNDGIWDWDIATDEVFRSSQWKSILGYADHEVPDGHASFTKLLHPDDKAAVKAAIQNHMANNEPYALDYRLHHKNGDYRWVHGRGMALRDAAGRAVRMVGTITDITARKEAERALRESEARYRAIFEISSVGMCQADPWTGRIHRVNRSFCEMTGYSEAEIVSRSFREITYPEDRKVSFHQNVDLNGSELGEYRTEKRYVRKDGTALWADVTINIVAGQDGEPVNTVTVIQDITAQRQAREFLQQVNADLESRVAERTRQLEQEMKLREDAQRTLGQAQKMDAIGQLTAGIAHDFNNLLAVIGGGLEFVERASKQGLPAAPELIEASLRASRRGRDLVRQLLAFARQLPMHAEPTQVDRLMLDTLRLLQRALGGAVEIDVKLDARAAMVLVDRGQMANALINLAVNARDAMPDGGQLTIVTACLAAKWASQEGIARWPTGDEVCITISDTGHGMTDEVRRRAFEPFFTTKTDGTGSGLGLSMVHGFVEQSGGHIEIENGREHGTVITIRLPRIEASMQPDLTVVDAIAPGQNEKTVLLVEDDIDVRTITAAQLKDLGYRVHAVADGHEALDLIVSPARYDVLLTDIMLPAGINGLTVVKEAMRMRPTIGVLCMTGYAPTQKHVKWLKVQNIQCLEKPFTVTELAQALDDVVAH